MRTSIVDDVMDAWGLRHGWPWGVLRSIDLDEATRAAVRAIHTPRFGVRSNPAPGAPGVQGTRMPGVRVGMMDG